MKLLKYILFFLISFLFNINVSATEIVVAENQNVFFNYSDGATQTNSDEYTWLGLLYLQENSNLVISNTETVLSYSQSFSLVNPELIDSWKLLDEYMNDDYTINQDVRCFLYGLSSNDRQKIWEEAGEYTWGSDKETFFIEVLKQTPPCNHKI